MDEPREGGREGGRGGPEREFIPSTQPSAPLPHSWGPRVPAALYRPPPPSTAGPGTLRLLLGAPFPLLGQLGGREGVLVWSREASGQPPPLQVPRHSHALSPAVPALQSGARLTHRPETRAPLASTCRRRAHTRTRRPRASRGAGSPHIPRLPAPLPAHLALPTSFQLPLSICPTQVCGLLHLLWLPMAASLPCPLLSSLHFSTTSRVCLTLSNFGTPQRIPTSLVEWVRVGTQDSEEINILGLH
jgi:hypothetical protein